MRIGLVTDGLSELPLPQMLDAVADAGIEMIELPSGNWSPAPHMDLDELVSSSAARKELVEAVSSRGLEISNFNCNGNVFNPRDGEQQKKVVEDTIRLSGELGIDKVVMMSGLPAAPGSSMPTWVTSSFPPELLEFLDWQWDEVAIPFWHDLVAFAAQHGVTRIALELHPQQLVYNVSSFRRLREAVGEAVGVNMDPSHLLFMGADPRKAIDVLGPGTIYHVHAKDTQVNEKAGWDSTYETLPWSEWQDRSWNYVTLGRGHPDGAAFWADFVRHLEAVGYDDVLSIEHEDMALGQLEGVHLAVALLKGILDEERQT